MPIDPRRVKDLFHAALDLDDPAARAALLDRECAGDAELRARLDDLLAAVAKPASALERPLVADATAADFAPGDASALPTSDTGDSGGGADEPAPTLPPLMTASPLGTTIAGRYMVRQEIGEGGMGTVYLAEQVQPVKRLVALKLIRAGMDSRQVLARFESERQALAIMDHPHIARVLDAGTTEAGHPFFVMELVRGVPLTDYCDRHRLGLRERLQLFRQVCAAVQHAHQKGVIHRDLKPTNILVEDHDGTPVPKVIDFGLAKAITGLQLSEQSVFTAFGSIHGTPLYMAPEQATFNAIDVDTRADIYALGVILYELLTGSTPIRKETLERAALDEVLRIVREDEPPVPSSRISTSEALPSLAANRLVEPARLGRFVRGDLDWVVMKALAKDRARRYESAVGLANDVERFLNDEPVTAGPPTARYRAAKFVRRHRGQVVAAALVVLALVGGVVGTTLGLIEARHQQDAADQQRRLALAEAAEKEKARQAEATQRDRAEKRLAQHAKAIDIMGSIFDGLNPNSVENNKEGKPLLAQLGERLDRAAAQIEGEAIGDPLTVARMQACLVGAQTTLGHPRKAIELAEKSMKQLSAILGPDHPETLTTLNDLGLAYLEAMEPNRVVPLFEQVLEMRRAKQGPDHDHTLTAMNNLASAYLEAGEPGRAAPLFEQALAIQRAKLGPDHASVAFAMNSLGNAYRDLGQPDRAAPLFEQALAIQRAKLGPDHFQTLISMNNLGRLYSTAGQIDRAVPLFEQALAGYRATLGTDHPEAIACLIGLAGAYLIDGKTDRAVSLSEQAVEACRAKLGPDHLRTLAAMASLANAYSQNFQPDRAVPLLEQALAGYRGKLGPDHPNTLMHMRFLADAYKNAGRYDRAVPLLEQALAIQRVKLGPDHPDTFMTMRDLADAHQGGGRPDRAVPLFEQLLAMKRAKIGPEHPDTLTTTSRLATSYAEGGQVDRAIAILEQPFQEWKASWGPTTCSSGA